MWMVAPGRAAVQVLELGRAQGHTSLAKDKGDNFLQETCSGGWGSSTRTSFQLGKDKGG